MSGFNDRKVIDELYKSGKKGDETDNHRVPPTDDVGRLCVNLLVTVCPQLEFFYTC